MKISHLFILPALMAAFPVFPNYVAKIGIVVDKKAITQRDIDSRIALILTMTKQEDTPENRKKIRDRALDMLIREQLQLKEVSEKLKKEGTITDAEVNEHLKKIAEQNNMTENEFLEAITGGSKNPGVDIVGAFKNQIKAQMAWSRFVRYLGGHVTEREIDKAQEKLNLEKEGVIYDLSEIVLYTNKIDQSDTAKKQAQDILEQIKKGVSFYTLAQQFSESSTAEKGGKLGRQSPQQIDPIILKGLSSMKIGDVQIFNTSKGIKIIRLNSMTKNSNSTEEVVDLKIVQINFDEQTLTEQTYNDINEKIAALTELKSAAEFSNKAKSLGLSVQSANDVSVTTIQPEEFANAIKQAKIGSVLQPVKTASGLQIFCIAHKGIKKNVPLTRKEIENMLLFEKQAKIADSYMNKLVARSMINHKED